VRSLHDCSEGGLAVTAAEMCLGGGLGAELHLSALPRPSGLDEDLTLLFSESASRFLAEVEPGHAEEVEALLAGVPHARLGTVLVEPLLRCAGAGTAPGWILEAEVEELRRAWRGTLAFGEVES
jgi:phosphoribosylformylglycinamidine synthase